MIQDTINSLRLTLSERLGNPFLSSALISCLVLNWQLTLLLFAPLTYDERVAKIYELYPDLQSASAELIVKPAIVGLVWFFFWPVICLGLNAYWYRMKSRISNSKLHAERRQVIGETEAAELYARIDEQKGQYLDLLRDDREKIEALQKQIEKHESTLRKNASTLKSEQGNSRGLEQQISNINTQLRSLERENESRRHRLEELENLALDFANCFPGLKPITNLLNESPNYQASEAWILDRLKSLPHPLPHKADAQACIDFLVALGLLNRKPDREISFGERYRYKRGEVVGAYPNSPELT